jgi:glycosyltransferase involved in cell wall biosynthesis
VKLFNIFFEKVKLLEGLYTERYPDVNQFRFRPIVHWMFHGLIEKRVFFPSLTLKVSSNNVNVSASFATRAHSRESIPSEVIDEFDKSSELDSGIPQSQAVSEGNFRIYPGSSVRLRTGIDPEKLIRYFEKSYSAVFIISRLVTGGAEKYISELASAASDGNMQDSILLIATEDTKQQLMERQLPSDIEILREAEWLFWSPLNGFPDNEETFARFIRGLSTKALFVCNSDLGYRMLARFSRGISTATSVICIFFSFGPPTAKTYARIYARKLIGKVLFLTDNTEFSRQALTIDPTASPEQLAVIPAPCQSPSFEEFRELIRDRFQNVPALPDRWLWIGRIEKYKDIAVLSELAKIRDGDRFDLFGTLESGNLSHELLGNPNVNYMGLRKDWSDFPFNDYSGLIFTSAFEGMPNVLVECSQKAIPLFISDVGGIRDTFDESNASIVERLSDPKETAQNFSKAIERYHQLSDVEKEKLIEEAYSRVRLRHSLDGFKLSVKKLIEAGAKNA